MDQISSGGADPTVVLPISRRDECVDAFRYALFIAVSGPSSRMLFCKRNLGTDA